MRQVKHNSFLNGVKSYTIAEKAVFAEVKLNVFERHLDITLVKNPYR